jgi:hypothetical protein
MLLGYIALVIGLIASALSIFLASSNSQLSLTAFSTTLSIPAYLALPTGWLAGALSVLAYRQLTLPKVQNEKILQNWDKQDARLQSEIQTDKVKQLEAKIETLEIALQSAIKKKKR